MEGGGYETAYSPTLEELIDACGNDFRWLKHNTHDPEHIWMAQGRPHWKTIDGKGLPEPRCWGKTPIEAVAKLWLSLNTLIK